MELYCKKLLENVLDSTVNLSLKDFFFKDSVYITNLENIDDAVVYLSKEVSERIIFEELMFVRIAYEKAYIPEQLQELDGYFGLCCTSVEYTQMSRVLAKNILHKMNDVFSIMYMPQYFPVAYGAFCAWNNIDERMCLMSFINRLFKDVIKQLANINGYSKFEMQFVFNEVMKNVSGTIDKCMNLELKEMCCFCNGIYINHVVTR